MGVGDAVDGHMATVTVTIQVVDGHPTGLQDAILGLAVRKSDIMSMIDHIP